jgi:pentatricopeptide repeat protein
LSSLLFYLHTRIHSSILLKYAGEALALYKQMQESKIYPSLATYEALYSVFASNADLDFAQAMKIHERMTQTVPEMKPLSDTFTSLVKMCNTHRQFEKLLSFYKEMEKAGITPTFECAHMAVNACDELIASEVSTGFHRQLNSRLKEFIQNTYPKESGTLN